MATGVYERTEYHRNGLKVPHIGSGIYKRVKPRSSLQLTNGFKKGHIGFNKGVKFVHYNCVECGKLVNNREIKRCRKCDALKKRGSGHWNWKGGITEENHRIRHSIEYKLWRQAVFARDNYTCIWCGGESHGDIEADHIKPFSLYPELRLAIDNGRTLCRKCHQTTETHGCNLINKKGDI